ncbi:collagen alpha-1(XII) chain [Biomphalaria glabrata]|nr:collagen alpha-1(XII) chain [Biomphalaria glabrata]
MFNSKLCKLVTTVLSLLFMASYTAAGLVKTCDIKLGDIIFILDVSSSIGDKNFEIQKHYVSNITRDFTVSPTQVRFGCLIFDANPTKQFDLKDYLDNDSLSKAILDIKYPYKSGTHTHKALMEVLEKKMFDTEAGGRDDAPNIVIVITDGLSTYPEKTKLAAKELKSRNIITIAIGIGLRQSTQELGVIASDPSLVFNVTDFSVLSGIAKDLVRKTCGVATTTTTTEEPTTTTTTEEPTTTTTTTTTTTAYTRPPYPPSTPTPCKNTTKADIILVIDASTSIGPTKWLNQTLFASTVTSYFNVGPEEVQFGALIFNAAPVKLFDLKTYSDHASLSKALLDVKYPNTKGTFTSKALNAVVEWNMFGEAAGGRADAPNIVILMTDGKSNNKTETVQAANNLKAAVDATILAVGIGADVNKGELKAVASDDKYVFYSQDYIVLDYISKDLISVTCRTAGDLQAKLK